MITKIALSLLAAISVSPDVEIGLANAREEIAGIEAQLEYIDSTIQQLLRNQEFIQSRDALRCETVRSIQLALPETEIEPCSHVLALVAALQDARTSAQKQMLEPLQQVRELSEIQFCVADVETQHAEIELKSSEQWNAMPIDQRTELQRLMEEIEAGAETMRADVRPCGEVLPKAEAAGLIQLPDSYRDAL